MEGFGTEPAQMNSEIQEGEWAAFPKAVTDLNGTRLSCNIKNIHNPHEREHEGRAGDGATASWTAVLRLLRGLKNPFTFKN